MEQKKVRWTVVDTVILIVVIAVLGVGAVKFGPKLMNNTSASKISFTVMLKEQQEELVNEVKTGDRVTISLTEKDGGEITDIKTEPSERLTFNSIDGKYIEEPVKDREDVYLTIEADCVSSDTAFKVGDTDIKVGKEIPVRGKGYASLGYIITINE